MTKESRSVHILYTTDQTLTGSEKPHTHEPGILVTEKAEFTQSLKRKSSDQLLSATQNLLSEAVVNCNAELNMEPLKIDSLVKIVQYSRTKSSGLANHLVASQAKAFVLPCMSQYYQRGEHRPVLRRQGSGRIML